MRLAFWRTEKPVARPVLQPGADSPCVPRLGVWMEAAPSPEEWEQGHCWQCGVKSPTHRVHSASVYWIMVHEGCGAKLVAQLRREREG